MKSNTTKLETLNEIKLLDIEKKLAGAARGKPADSTPCASCFPRRKCRKHAPWCK